ncbi:uncharacterized protein LOC1270040 isoform X3 [Anopheles gambiae]|uniref:uncharacterized protein LOC1270040 isoform X3 n=1 Tax=Anopheles gambiae TaxID=7165 RepID=UPI001AAC6F1E|nr:uncharacterized protein LOC1270040 isoform X3 [Anopheles gambiae]
MDPSFDLPSEEQLLEVLADATPEEQAKLLALLQQLPHLPQVVQALRRETVFKATLYRQISFAVAVLLVLSLFAFFGYKLYLSLTEKERKREEKLKAKQEKSKKKK